MEPEHQPHDEPHLPAPSLWPIGFAIGIVVLLVGLIINPILISTIGAAIAVVFGVLWGRDATAELRSQPVDVEPERREMTEAGGDTAPNVEPAGRATTFSPARPSASAPSSAADHVAGARLHGPAGIRPPAEDQGRSRADSNFAIGRWYVTTFVSDPKEGAVSRRTAFIRNNGTTPNPSDKTQQVPSFSIISNHCAHLGCPVQANGPTDKYIGEKIVHEHTLNGPVTMDPAIVAGYGCPCHGGQYDTEGNRTAGPPTHGLDRYDFEIVKGRLVLLAPYSVSHVVGTGATAQIYKYKEAGPGEHIDGPEQILYPIQPPHN